jgi:serine phosphatase RsbU (regulator of sigma subunit)
MKAIGLKVQITVLVILFLTGIISVFSWTVATNERQMLLAEVRLRALLQARNIAMSSSKMLLLESSEFELRAIVSSAIKADPNILSIALVDAEGIIVGHTEVSNIDMRYERISGLNAIADDASFSEGETVSESAGVFEVSVPVTNLSETVGTVHLQYSKDEVQLAVDRMNVRMMRIGLVAIAVGAVVSLLLALHITHPVSLLTKSVEAFGRGNLDARIKINSAREIQILVNTFNEMARRIKHDRKALIEKKRMEKELEIAHEIQATLLPNILPHLRDYEMDVYYHPAAQVGGDYFDMVQLDDRHVFVVVGDVAGKGVPGLVVMAMVRIIVRALALQRKGPAELLRHLNALLRRDMKKNLFVTLFCGVLDAGRGILVYASAAHMPLLIYRGRERIVHMLGTKTKPLGLFPDDIFSQTLEEKSIEINPGDLFLQYTDGLNEMKNAEGEEYGMEQLMQLVVDEGAGGARHILGRLRSELIEFRGNEPQSDDLTLLAVSVLPKGMKRAPAERMELRDRVVFG